MTDVDFHDQPPKEISDAWEQMLKVPVWNLEDFLSYWETTTYGKFLIEKSGGDESKRRKLLHQSHRLSAFSGSDAPPV